MTYRLYVWLGSGVFEMTHNCVKSHIPHALAQRMAAFESIVDARLDVVLLLHHRVCCSTLIRCTRIKEDHMLGILRLSLAFVVIVTLAACGTLGAAPTTAQSFA